MPKDKGLYVVMLYEGAERPPFDREDILFESNALDFIGACELFAEIVDWLVHGDNPYWSAIAGGRFGVVDIWNIHKRQMISRFDYT